MLESTNEYKAINAKMGETVSLSVEKLSVSEYNTRSTCIDQNHVDALAKKILERGFHPKRAISVNVIKGAGGEEISYRVAAGIHRLAAAKKAGLTELPCLLYYDLTEEEECLLDKWDNEMDEDHKPIHFLEEAEHYRYLQEVKGWSGRQIARNKNVSKSIANDRLKIAFIPEEAKKSVKSVRHGGHFSERHFRDICKLKKEPHIIRVCAEIAERGRLAEKKVKDKNGHPIQPMRQSEIKERVREFLDKENKGIIERKVQTPLPRQLELFSDGAEESQEEKYITETVVTMDEEKIEDEENVQPPTEPIPELPDAMLHRSPNGDLKGVYFDRFPRWVKCSGLIKELGYPAFVVMKKLGEFDIWYLAGKEGTFFLSAEIYGDPLNILAEGAGVSKEHVQKKILPELEKQGYIEYEFRKGEIRFTFNWNKLGELYKKTALGIPAKEGGLKNIPQHFSGTIKPTHFHHVRVVKGTVTEWSVQKPGPETPPDPEDAQPILATEEQELGRTIVDELHIERGEVESLIREYPRERIEKALNASRDKQNPAGWFLKALKENYNLESGGGNGKDTYAGLRREADACFRNCGGGCASNFKRYDKEKDACFWCSKFDSIRDKMAVETG